MATEVGTGYISTYLDNKGIQDSLGALGGELGAKFGPLGQTAGMALGTKLSAALSPATEDAGAKITSLSGLLDAAGPWGIAAGAAVAGAAAIGGALYKMGSDFETQYRTIARNTGATGTQLASLDQSFRDVASHSAASFGQVTQAIDEVQRYTGPTGKSLDALSGQFLTLSRISGTDVASNVEAGVHALENWNVPAKIAPTYLNELFTASQKSGVSFSTLASQVTQFGPGMRQLGYSFTQSAAMIAQWSKEGLNSQRMITALMMGSSKLAKQQTTDNTAIQKAEDALTAAHLKLATASGKNLVSAHQAVTVASEKLSVVQKKAATDSGSVAQQMQVQINAIKNAKTSTDALAIASTLFGTRGAVQMTEAIRSGRFSADEMTHSLKDAGNSITDTGKRTQTVSGSFHEMKNATEVAFAPLSTALFQGINKGLIDIMNYITPLMQTLSQDLPGVIKTLTPLFQTFGTLMADQFRLAAPLIKTLFDALGLVVDLLTGRWGPAWNEVINLFHDVTNVISGLGREIEDSLLAPFRALGIDVPQALSSAWGAISSWASGMAKRILDAFGDVGTQLYDWGAHIIQRLADGITSAAGSALKGAASAAMSVIKSVIPFSPAQTGPFSGAKGDPRWMGENIGNMLAAGLTKSANAVGQAATAMITPAAAAVPGLGGPVAGAAAALGPAAYNGPAVVIQNATFTNEADIESFMRQAAWTVQTGKL